MGTGDDRTDVEAAGAGAYTVGDPVDATATSSDSTTAGDRSGVCDKSVPAAAPLLLPPASIRTPTQT